MKQIYTIEFKNYTTGTTLRETLAADNPRRARSNFIRRMRYHGHLEEGDQYSVTMLSGDGERHPEQLTMEV